MKNGGKGLAFLFGDTQIVGFCVFRAGGKGRGGRGKGKGYEKLRVSLCSKNTRNHCQRRFPGERE